MLDEFLAAGRGPLVDSFLLITFVLLLAGVPLFIAEIIALLRDRRLDKRRILALATSAFCLVPAMFVESSLGGALPDALGAIHSVSLLPIPTTWWSALLCLVLADFVYYWEHRAAHRINLLWAAYHSTHHSAEHFDQSVGLRVSFMDFFFTPLFYVPLVLVGFHPLLVLACLSLVLAWQQWIHTEVIDRLPRLDGWLNTPSNHRVHHGRNQRYLDKNYGGILIVWDRLFGTYAAETERVEYGLVEQLPRQDPITVHFGGLVGLVRSLSKARLARDIGRIVLGPPEKAKP
jgi:sterol desaturase/sphingolipid hydroxylase (fatty acid hydroxylase superfamily)